MPKAIKICCIHGCGNTPQSSENTTKSITFYKFPYETKFPSWRNEKRQQWIDAVGMWNKGGSPWQPKKNTLICSVHFEGGRKSENSNGPSCIPTLFPISHQTLSTSRQSSNNEYVGILKKKDSKFRPLNLAKEGSLPNAEIHTVMEKLSSPVSQPKQKLHKFNVAAVSSLTRSIGCQANLPQDKPHSGFNYFECNRMIDNDVCTAEVQVSIVSSIDGSNECDISVDMMNKRDVACGPSFYEKQKSQIRGFEGMNSIKSDAELTDFCGITFDTFDLLVSLLPDICGKELNLKNKLLIFLMKLKMDLTCSALGLLFNVHQSTVWKTFLEILKCLPTLLEEYMNWPTKDEVKNSLPKLFKTNYPNCRVVMDCIEIRVEQPSTVEQRKSMYSSNKMACTVKFLLACTPSGFISLKSKCYPGGISDEFIAHDCGILNFIEAGDLVLANKEFGNIKKNVEKKRAQFVMPPLLKEHQFLTSEVGKPRIAALIQKHVKRCMEQIKIFQILSFLPADMLAYADSIIQICCSLVNLQLSKSKAKS